MNIFCFAAKISSLGVIEYLMWDTLIVFLFLNFCPTIEIGSPTDVKRSHNQRRRSMFSLRQKLTKRDCREGRKVKNIEKFDTVLLPCLSQY